MAQRLPWLMSNRLLDELVFALLEEEKERRYAETDEIQEGIGINYQYLSKLELRKDSNKLYFHYDEVGILPFDVPLVAQTIRNCLSYAEDNDPMSQCQPVTTSDNEFQVDTRYVRLRSPAPRGSSSNRSLPKQTGQRSRGRVTSGTRAKDISTCLGLSCADPAQAEQCATVAMQGKPHCSWLLTPVDSGALDEPIETLRIT